MAEEATQPKQEKSVVTINGEEYNVADLSQQQIALLNQVVDLDNKTNQMGFNLAHAQGARSFFMAQLTASVEAPAEPEVVKEDS